MVKREHVDDVREVAGASPQSLLGDVVAVDLISDEESPQLVASLGIETF
jgi:hypothetical protein